jgi:hypothetical protein
MDSKLDLLLHPIRLRIIMAVIGRHLTPGQIAALIPDVPQTTLYRQINTLVEGKILAVVAEKQVRGTMERSYGLIDGAGMVGKDDLNALSADDHLRHFTVFVSAMLHDFAKYVKYAEAHQVPLDEGMYNKVALYLSESERTELLSQFRALIQPYMREDRESPAKSPRQRYLLSSVALPDPDDKRTDEGATS